MGIFTKESLHATIIYGPLTSYQVSEKTNETISRKITDRRKDQWTDPIL